MADKVQQSNSEDQEIEKTKPEEKPVEDKKDKVENGDDKSAENGDSKDEDAKDETTENDTDKSEEKILKRKSTGGGDATDSAASEGATPEKKAKTAESTEAEAQEDAKAVA